MHARNFLARHSPSFTVSQNDDRDVCRPAPVFWETTAVTMYLNGFSSSIKPFITSSQMLLTHPGTLLSSNAVSFRCVSMAWRSSGHVNHCGDRQTRGDHRTFTTNGSISPSTTNADCAANATTIDTATTVKQANGTKRNGTERNGTETTTTSTVCVQCTGGYRRVYFTCSTQTLKFTPPSHQNNATTTHRHTSSELCKSSIVGVQ